jgi:hypothetical protein
MKQFRNVMMLMVMMFVAVNASAQIMGNIVVERGPGYLVTDMGYVYETDNIPGSNQMAEGDNIQMVMNNYWMRLQSNPTAYQRQYNYYATHRPVCTGQVAVSGMMMGTTLPMGGGMMMAGGNGGYVCGAGGAAAATSTVHIDNSNMLSTLGSGMQMNMYDGKVSLSGDPLMAINRVVSAFGGSKKANQQQTVQSNYNNGGNVRVVYVDAATGQQVQPQTRSQQQTQVRTQAQQQTQQMNNGVASQPVYNVYSGF